MPLKISILIIWTLPLGKPLFEKGGTFTPFIDEVSKIVFVGLPYIIIYAYCIMSWYCPSDTCIQIQIFEDIPFHFRKISDRALAGWAANGYVSLSPFSNIHIDIFNLTPSRSKSHFKFCSSHGKRKLFDFDFVQSPVNFGCWSIPEIKSIFEK